MLATLWMVALLLRSAEPALTSLIGTVNRDTLKELAQRWKPSLIQVEEERTIVSTTRGGVGRYMSMMVMCYSHDVTHGVVHMDGKSQMSLFAIRNNGTLVCSVTSVIDDREFRQIAREVALWHGLTLQMPLSIVDAYAKAETKGDHANEEGESLE